MDTSVDQLPFAWQPLTPRGVAAFARASLGRLLLVQFVIALIAAGAIVWFLHATWFSTISAAIDQLPQYGEIRSGRLDWYGNSPETLAESRYLALTVDLKHEGEARSPAHVQVEFGRTDFKVFSLFGFLPGDYPRDLTVAFNREALDPWWGAWAPAILAIVAGVVVVGLMLTWALLATVWFFPVWLIGFFANRDLNLRGSWRLAGAALMPGALFLSGTIVLYGLGALDLIQLTVAATAHFVIGWGYLLASPLCAPPCPAVGVVKGNPFGQN